MLSLMHSLSLNQTLVLVDTESDALTDAESDALVDAESDALR